MNVAAKANRRPHLTNFRIYVFSTDWDIEVQFSVHLFTTSSYNLIVILIVHFF